MHVAPRIMGPWKEAGDPMAGPASELTFGGQSTFVLPVQGKPGKFIFMADKWNPEDLKDSRHIWLPVEIKGGEVKIVWHDSWKL